MEEVLSGMRLLFEHEDSNDEVYLVLQNVIAEGYTSKYSKMLYLK